MPLGTIKLSVTFGDVVHYQRETPSFEVVDFQGPYSAIFGRPCYVKFMEVPNYAYLKLKMPRPKGVIRCLGTSRMPTNAKEMLSNMQKPMPLTKGAKSGTARGLRVTLAPRKERHLGRRPRCRPPSSSTRLHRPLVRHLRLGSSSSKLKKAADDSL
jgi:hypothetical protein